MTEDGKRVAIGRRQTLRALAKDQVSRIYIASDAEEHVVRDVIGMCKEKKIDVVKVESREILGKTYGIDVGASVVAVVDKES